MFGGIAPMELIIIAVIALVVLGPSRLPDAARSVGKGMREMREAFSTSGDDDDNFDTRRFERVDEDDEDELDGDQESEAAPAPTDEKAEASSSVPAEKA